MSGAGGNRTRRRLVLARPVRRLLLQVNGPFRAARGHRQSPRLTRFLFVLVVGQPAGHPSVCGYEKWRSVASGHVRREVRLPPMTALISTVPPRAST